MRVNQLHARCSLGYTILPRPELRIECSPSLGIVCVFTRLLLAIKLKHQRDSFIIFEDGSCFCVKEVVTGGGLTWR